MFGDSFYSAPPDGVIVSIWSAVSSQNARCAVPAFKIAPIATKTIMHNIMAYSTTVTPSSTVTICLRNRRRSFISTTFCAGQGLGSERRFQPWTTLKTVRLICDQRLRIRLSVRKILKEWTNEYSWHRNQRRCRLYRPHNPFPDLHHAHRRLRNVPTRKASRVWGWHASESSKGVGLITHLDCKGESDFRNGAFDLAEFARILAGILASSATISPKFRNYFAWRFQVSRLRISTLRWASTESRSVWARIWRTTCLGESAPQEPPCSKKCFAAWPMM